MSLCHDPIRHRDESTVISAEGRSGGTGQPGVIDTRSPAVSDECAYTVPAASHERTDTGRRHGSPNNRIVH
jgi:hypothetical protein